MASEEIISTSIDESGFFNSHSLAHTRVVAGPPDEVRPRLVEALERLGFHVIEEQPLVARRRTKGLADAGCTTKVRELPTTLVVRLKPASENATEATFNYTIRGSMLLRGDRRVVAREVDAAVALAAAHDQSSACSRCGTGAFPDSRFCRRCGAPLASYEPAELEVLRISAGTEAASQWVGFGFSFILLGLLLLVLAAFAPGFPVRNPLKITSILTVFAWTLAGLGLLGTLRGAMSLRRTLGSAPPEREVAPERTGRALAEPGPAQLAPPPEYTSVTEHTTNLLDEPPAPIPIRLGRRTGDTG
jgi:hypothetical protein